MVSTLGHILASIKPAKFPLSQTSSQFPCSAQLSLPAPVCSKSAFPEHYTLYLGTDLINILYHRTLVLTIVKYFDYYHYDCFRRPLGNWTIWALPDFPLKGHLFLYTPPTLWISSLCGIAQLQVPSTLKDPFTNIFHSHVWTNSFKTTLSTSFPFRQQKLEKKVAKFKLWRFPTENQWQVAWQQVLLQSICWLFTVVTVIVTAWFCSIASVQWIPSPAVSCAERWRLPAQGPGAHQGLGLSLRAGTAWSSCRYTAGQPGPFCGTATAWFDHDVCIASWLWTGNTRCSCWYHCKREKPSQQYNCAWGAVSQDCITQLSGTAAICWWCLFGNWFRPRGHEAAERIHKVCISFLSCWACLLLGLKCTSGTGSFWVANSTHVQQSEEVLCMRNRTVMLGWLHHTTTAITGWTESVYKHSEPPGPLASHFHGRLVALLCSWLHTAIQ